MTIKCPKCGKDISDKAVTCPECGYPIKENFNESINSQYKSLVTSDTTSLFSNDPIKGHYIEETKSLLRQGKKIQAIKVWGENTGLRLKEAKEAVEKLQQENNIYPSDEPESSGCFIATAACGISLYPTAVL